MGKKKNPKELIEYNFQSQIQQPIYKPNINTQTQVSIFNFFHFIRFSAGFYWGVQNAFVSLLMVAFGATWDMDRFIWLIPLLMRLLIQPYAYNFIARSKLCKVYLKSKVIAYLHLISALGVGLIIYSSYISDKDYLKRIIFSTIGWTTSGICLGISIYLGHELQALILEDPTAHKIIKAHSSSEYENIFEKDIKLVWHQFIKLKIKYFSKNFSFEALGQTLGYLVSFGISLFAQSDSFKEFYKLNNSMYAICAIVHLFIFAYFTWKIRNFKQKLQQHPKKRQKINKMFQNLIKLTKTNFKERIFLTIHFIVFFMVDLFVIFATLWVGAVYPKEFNQGKTYIYGIKVGSLYLVLFMLISNIKLPKIKDWNIERTVNFLRHYSIFYLILGVACFTIFEQKIILAFVISGAVLVSIYRKKIYPQMMKEEMFQSCVGIVQRLQKVFRVSFFPLFINIVFRQKAYSIWVTKFFLTVVLVCILVFFVDTIKNPLKKIEEQATAERAKIQ